MAKNISHVRTGLRHNAAQMSGMYLMVFPRHTPTRIEHAYLNE